MKKELKEESKKLESLKSRVAEMSKSVSGEKGKHLEDLLRGINVLRHKIMVAEERFNKPATITDVRSFALASDGFYKR